MKAKETKRLFFGASIAAPWPANLPKGRVLDEKARHMTLAFLGEVDFSSFEPLLRTLPKPSFRFGPFGKCSKILFLPKNHPRVVAAEPIWMEDQNPLTDYHTELLEWLSAHDFKVDERPFFPHITLARAPFAKEEWKETLEEFPFFISGIHLYESIGNLIYESLWSHRLLAPFEELEHTADIAFLIQGENLSQLHLHAKAALAFKYPSILPYLTTQLKNELDEIIIDLNDSISKVDQVIGSPFKAVSFHGEAKRSSQNILQWEMIVDV